MVDNEYGYCFGAHLNFDPSLDRKTIQAEVEKSGDLSKPYPHRRFARLWIDADHVEASAKSTIAKRRKLVQPEASSHSLRRTLSSELASDKLY